MAIKRQVLRLPRNAQRAVAAGVVGAAALSALLLPAAPASAAPVTVPGVGTVDVPEQILGQLPPGVVTPSIQIPDIAPQGPQIGETVGQRAVDAAMSKLGAPYAYGAAGPDAFDCSGLVKWSYEQAGRELPRTSYEQFDAGAPVSLDVLQPGDVVLFYGGSHSALYVGDGNVIHASTYGQPVAIASMSSMPVAGARRY
ncbi:C40 family peptidase [Nocardia sp. NPDC101769]|uniref:C40 family peptidase n=1 Tax=Nocardia sp. NPDC101769 TaxID=3364333 RepID=UPI0037F49E55